MLQMPSMNQAMRLLSRLNRDTSRNKVFSSITNKLVIFENILLDRGGGGQISTPIYRDTEPGVSCAKIGVQTVTKKDFAIKTDVSTRLK